MTAQVSIFLFPCGCQKAGFLGQIFHYILWELCIEDIPIKFCRGPAARQPHVHPQGNPGHGAPRLTSPLLKPAFFYLWFPIHHSAVLCMKNERIYQGDSLQTCQGGGEITRSDEWRMKAQNKAWWEFLVPFAGAKVRRKFSRCSYWGYFGRYCCDMFLAFVFVGTLDSNFYQSWVK